MRYIIKSEIEDKYGDRLIRLTSLSTGDITFLYNNHVSGKFKVWVEYMSYESNLIVGMDNFELATLLDTLSYIRAIYYIVCNDTSLGKGDNQPGLQNSDTEEVVPRSDMGSPTFIAKWKKHIRGTSYPVDGNDTCWRNIADLLTTGGAVVMYERDNPKVPIVFDETEFHGILPFFTKLDDYCMVHLMDSEFLKLRDLTPIISNESELVSDDDPNIPNMCNDYTIDIYALKLHQSCVIYTNHIGTGDAQQESQRYYVTRIAGGWLYQQHTPGLPGTTCVFVPFNNEFQQ